MTAKDFRAIARNCLRDKWGIMIAITLIYNIVITAASYLLFGAWLVSGAATIGLLGTYLTLCHGGTPEIGSLFDGFKQDISNRIVGGLLYNLYLFAWSFLFILPGFVKRYSYAMTFYIMRDNPGMDANQAITLSRKMMNGHKADLFCLHLSFIGWILLSILTCGVGMLVVAPYMYAAETAFYEDLKARTDYFGGQHEDFILNV